jgi:hypothetical protein
MAASQTYCALRYRISVAQRLGVPVLKYASATQCDSGPLATVFEATVNVKAILFKNL